MGAVKNDVLLILYVISMAQVTSRGDIVNPGHCFNSKGVGTKSEACHAVNQFARKVKKHVSGKDIWQIMMHRSLLPWTCPSTIAEAFVACSSSSQKQSCFLV